MGMCSPRFLPRDTPSVSVQRSQAGEMSSGGESAEIWESRELLPGRTVNQLGGYALCSMGVALIGMVGALVYAFTIVARDQRWDPFTVGFLTLFGLGILVAWIFNLVGDRKGKAEVHAGYTTAAQGNNQVARLHSPTGVVMRSAGEPNLTKVEWEAAMRRVHAYKASSGASSTE
jgi:hypothetical protein